MVLALACLLRKVPTIARMSGGSGSHSLTTDTASHPCSYAAFVEILNKGVMGQWQLIWHAHISEGMPAVWHTCDKMHVVCVLSINQQGCPGLRPAFFQSPLVLPPKAA